MHYEIFWSEMKPFHNLIIRPCKLLKCKGSRDQKAHITVSPRPFQHLDEDTKVENWQGRTFRQQSYPSLLYSHKLQKTQTKQSSTFQCPQNYILIKEITPFPEGCLSAGVTAQKECAFMCAHAGACVYMHQRVSSCSGVCGFVLYVHVCVRRFAGSGGAWVSLIDCDPSDSDSDSTLFRHVYRY